jgi:signal transduction histidine kinase
MRTTETGTPVTMPDNLETDRGRDSAEEMLRRQDRLAGLGTLSATMAHEIKNALVAGKTFLDLLLEKHEDNELTEIVRKEMDRIDSIVTQILRYSAHSRQSFVETSVHEVLEDSLRLVTPKLDGQTIRLEKSFEAQPDLIHGSSYQLQQAFVNLFLNAVDALPTHGHLKITTSLITKTPASDPETHGLVQVIVADTGTGITPENLALLFQPFFTTKRNGTGLGLATTQRIFHEHGGTISVRSNPGQGTQFTIELPAMGKPQLTSTRVTEPTKR